MKTPLFAALVFISACAESEVDLGSTEQSVIGGELTPDGMFPATGGLVQFEQVMCTGTLVSPRVVVTAAHCVVPFFPGAEAPGFTLIHDGTGLMPGDVIAGVRAVPHPGFSFDDEPAPGVGRWDDIGILVLASPIENVPYAKMLRPSESSRALVADAPVELVGYGLTEVDGESAGIKHHGAATLIEVGEFELFIGNGPQQNCNGDSGGPALAALGDVQRMVGIVSRAPDMNPTCDHGGIDTRVDPYVSWIASEAPELCEDLECDEDGLPIPPDEDPDDPNADDDEGGGCQSGGQSGPVAACLFALLLGFAARRKSRFE